MSILRTGTLMEKVRINHKYQKKKNIPDFTERQFSIQITVNVSGLTCSRCACR